jgi:hypothetical protein
MAANNYGRRDSAFPNGAQQGYGFNGAESTQDNLHNELFMQQHIGEQSSPILREAYRPAYSTAATPPQQQQLASPQPHPRHSQHTSYMVSNLLNTSSTTLPATDYHYPPVSDGSSQYGASWEYGRTSVQGYMGTERSTADRTSG